MYPGKPCIFVEIGKGCKDYENRPEEPCKNYNCYWKLEEQVPEQFKPQYSGVIMSWSMIEGITYLDIEKAPNEPTAELLSWAFVHARRFNLNLRWKEANRIHWIGSPEFCNTMLTAIARENPTSPSR